MKNRSKISKLFLLIIALLFGSLVPGCVFAQDAADGRLHDALLDRLVGKWAISGIVHGSPSKSHLEAEWVMNHQFLRVYQRSEENVPAINAPFEGLYLIGYDHGNQRYIVHFICVWGGDDPTEGLAHGSRSGNEIKLIFKTVQAQGIVQRFTWEPESKSWHIVSRMMNAGKEGEPFIDFKVLPAGTQAPLTPTVQAKP